MVQLQRHCSYFVLSYALLNFGAAAQQHGTTADSVKAEFLYAWNAYKAYAWGHDALKPLSKQPHDWYKSSLFMTPVDAYDVMLLMRLIPEAAETKKLILGHSKDEKCSGDHDSLS